MSFLLMGDIPERPLVPMVEFELTMVSNHALAWIHRAEINPEGVGFASQWNA